MKKLDKNELNQRSKEELIKLLFRLQEDFEVELANTIDQVTKAVTDKLTKQHQEEMNQLLKKLADKNLTIKRYNKELFDSKAEHHYTGEIVANEAEKNASRKGRRKGSKNFENFDFESLVNKVTTVDIDIRKCPDCQTELVQFGEDISYKLYRRPAQFYVEKIVTPKYKCPKDGRLFQAISDRVFPHSCLTPELAASIVDSKLGLGEPLDRQSRYLQKHGFPISTQTLSNWYLDAADCLHPLFLSLQSRLVNTSCKCINGDETTISVLENEKNGRKKSYIFCFLSSFYEHPIYLYHFKTERSSEHIKEMLNGFDGYLTCDGYSGYNILKEQGVKINRCWVHARRQFLNIIKGLPEKEAKKTKSYQVVKRFNEIFQMDSKADHMAPEEKKKYRNTKEFKDKLNQLYDYVMKLNPENNTSLSKAVNYFKNAWDDMLTFLEDGHLEMTNNAAERAIKPFVINRKNFLFCKTERGADATAELFSVIQTAQANLLIPDQYLSYVMYHIKSEPIEDLLPWSDKIPEELRIHKEDLEKRND